MEQIVEFCPSLFLNVHHYMENKLTIHRSNKSKLLPHYISSPQPQTQEFHISTLRPSWEWGWGAWVGRQSTQKRTTGIGSFQSTGIGSFQSTCQKGQQMTSPVLQVVLGPGSLAGKAQLLSGVTLVQNQVGALLQQTTERKHWSWFQKQSVFPGRAAWAWLWTLPRSTNPSKFGSLWVKCSFKIQTANLYLNSNCCIINKSA